MAGPTGPALPASWQSGPAIHPVNPRRGMTFCTASRQNVDARVKHGHDGFLNYGDSETVRSTGIETSPPDLCVSVSLSGLDII